MIAGGTGISPMIQVIRAALKNPSDRTTITLIYANVNQEDILLKDDLEDLNYPAPRTISKLDDKVCFGPVALILHFISLLQVFVF